MPCSSDWIAPCAICGRRSSAAWPSASEPKMVVGLGIDVASVERMRVALTRFGDRLWQRVLTENEQADLATRPDRALALAGRFAAKEAAAKALGGQPDVWWHDVEIRPDSRGAPHLEFLGAGLV